MRKSSGKSFVRTNSPTAPSVVGGVFSAFGGGIGALVESWGLNALQNFIVRL